jgi:hypothetical protein
LKAKNELLNILVLPENLFENHVKNSTYGCLCKDLVDVYAMGMFLHLFCFGTSRGAILISIATAQLFP